MTKTIVGESKERNGEESISRMQSLAYQDGPIAVLRHT